MNIVHWFTHQDLADYRLLGDPILPMLGDGRARSLTSERWLRESEARRMIAFHLYMPLLWPPGALRVVDVGSGFSSLSFVLARKHEYLAVDLCAHDRRPAGIAVFEGDWRTLPEMAPDVYVAMDLFPNVDQRLDAFLARTAGTRTRLVLTTYGDRWYRTKRIDADEILTVQAWQWWQLATVLGAHGVELPPPPDDDLFGNGRQVCHVVL